MKPSEAAALAATGGSSADAEAALALLGEVSRVLGASLDFETTLAGIARVAVPRLADWCAVDLLDEAGQVRRVRVASVDAEHERLAGEAGLDSPADLESAACPIGQVLRTGEAVVGAEVPHAAEGPVSDGHASARPELQSYMILPLSARGQVLGSLSLLVSLVAGRRHGETELALAKVLAQRAALAIDNARLHLEVERQRDQLRIILDGVADGITVQDGSGAMVYANRTAAKASGYASAEALLCAPASELRARFQLLDAEGQELDFDVLPGRRALRGESGPPMTVRFLDRATAQTSWSRVQATPVLDRQGKVVSAINIVHDLTEDKRVEQALRDSEDRYRTILETMPVSLWEEDFTEVKAALDALARQGVEDVRAYLEAHPATVAEIAGKVKVLDVNQAAVRMMGASGKADLLGSLAHIFVPETLPTFVNELVAIAEGRSAFEGEGLIVTLEGKRRDVLVSLSLPTGSLERVLVSITDITERKRAEILVRRSEERYRTLVTASTSIVWTAAADGSIVGPVPAWEEFTGQTREAYRGWGWLAALHPADRAVSERIWRKGARRAGPVEGEFRVARQGGQYRRMKVRAVPVLDESGGVSEWIGTCSDVEDRKRFREEERRRELEEILSAHSMREKRRIARKLHDGVRQQLVGIRMLASNLHKKMAAAGLAEAGLMEEFARLVGDANTQVRELISDLAPARIEADGLLPALKRMANNIEQWYGVQCSVEVRRGATPTDDETADHLFYIAQEAVTNAAKHGRADNIRVAMRRKNGHLLLEIKDDGIGLPEDFDRRGGMGLANMRHRAELVGGRLDIGRSREGTTVVCLVNA